MPPKGLIATATEGARSRRGRHRGYDLGSPHGPRRKEMLLGSKRGNCTFAVLPTAGRTTSAVGNNLRFWKPSRRHNCTWSILSGNTLRW